MAQDPSPARSSSTIKAAAKIAFIYFLLSVAWITLSDRLLLALIQDPDFLTRVQTYKGWGFVLSTSILIFLLIWRVIDQLRLLDLRRLQARRRANLRLHRALMARKAARRQLEAVFSHASDGIVVISREQTILLINRQAEKFFSVGLADGGKEKLHGTILDHLRPGLATLYDKKGSVVTFDLKVTPAGTAELILNAAATPLYNRERELIGAVIVLRDVSRERYYDDLRNRFIANAAHQLKTPLTAIIGYSELIAELPDLNEGVREYVRVINDKGQTLSRIVDDLLDLSNVEKGNLPITYLKTCDLSPLLQSIVDQCRKVHRDRLFQLDLPAGTIPVRCDSKRIAQVVENLIDNAVKFSLPGTLVRVAVSPGTDFHRVCVSDQGIGMSADVADRIFERFYRADMSDTAPAGLGLGLSIAQGIIVAHGGTTWAESEPGRGTTLCFTVPHGAEVFLASEHA